MQIFVKWDKDNKTRTIEVDTIDTIGQLKEKIADKIEVEYGYRIPTNSDMRLRYNSKLLEDDAVTIGQIGIQKETTLQLHINMGSPFPATYDADVKPILAKDLQILEETQAAQFVFIGIGSYDNGHDEGIASIKRQQCPDDLLLMCNNLGCKLRVLLIDKAFIKSPSSDPPQIYKIDPNWERKENQDVEEGKVRRYYYKERDFQLWTYATNIFKAEYDGRALTIAGVDLSKLAREIVKYGGCIVIGNFFMKSAKPHLAEGDDAVLKKLGYKE
ncbi:MAG TPA: ubiquitin-like domain-containing protein [Ktedonosporobacter sp.]|jgi:hypothetical protein|nr:ubiquitin-like domain-containing protein [Ktedonosporobacter sp.]